MTSQNKTKPEQRAFCIIPCSGCLYNYRQLVLICNVHNTAKVVTLLDSDSLLHAAALDVVYVYARCSVFGIDTDICLSVQNERTLRESTAAIRQFLSVAGKFRYLVRSQVEQSIIAVIGIAPVFTLSYLALSSPQPVYLGSCT